MKHHRLLSKMPVRAQAGDDDTNGNQTLAQALLDFLVDFVDYLMAFIANKNGGAI